MAFHHDLAWNAGFDHSLYSSIEMAIDEDLGIHNVFLLRLFLGTSHFKRRTREKMNRSTSKKREENKGTGRAG